MHWPVIKLAASEARKMAVPTSSAIFPKRFMGVRVKSSLPRSVPSKSWEFSSVQEDTGRNRIYVDAFLRPFDCQAASQAQDSTLRGSIGRYFEEADKRIQRCNIDDFAVAAHRERLIETLATAQRACQVHVQQAVPFGFRDADRRFAKNLACGIDENIDAAETVEDRFTKFVDRFSARRIYRRSNRPPASGFDLARDLFYQCLPPARRYDIGARFRKPDRDGTSDSRRPAHHDSYPVLQIK